MPDDGRSVSPRSKFDSRASTVLVAAVMIVLAWLIYRPDRLRPFDILDFSEFIPVLQTVEGYPNRVRAVFEYYATQGRLNAIPYVLFATKWHLFSWWTPGWQVARGALMIVLFALTYVLLRRLGASRIGGLVGSSVFLWAPPASATWVRLTTAEPLGTAFAILLAIRAVRFQANVHWKRDTVFFALGTLAVIWTKELLVPVLLLPLGLALIVQPDGSFARPQLSPRNVALVTTVGVAAIAALVPVALVYLRAGPSAYASYYGQGFQSFSGLVAFWVLALVPFKLIVVSGNFVWALAVAFFVSLVGFGWRMGLRDPQSAQRATWLLLLALAVPMVGVLAYLPNPWYDQIYSLPHLIGAAILIGMATTWFSARSLGGRRFALAAWLAITLQAAFSAAHFSSHADAVQHRDAHVIAYVADSAQATHIQLATVQPPPHEWLGRGTTLSRMARAMGHPWPPTSNVSCVDALKNRGSVPSLITVTVQSSCKFKKSQVTVVSHRFRHVDLRRFRLVVDSVYAEIMRSDALLTLP